MEGFAETVAYCIVYSNISKYLQRYAVLCDAQHGFHSNRSCDTQLITTVAR